MDSLIEKVEISDNKKTISIPMLSFLLLNIFLIASTCFEQLNVNHGLGWDGEKYAAMVKNFIAYISDKGLDEYYIQRIFPSGVVYGIMRIFGISLTDDNIIRTFSVYNIILINVSLFIWFRVLALFNFSSATKAISLLLLLGNFCILKFCMFYPVLTDTTTFLLGMLFLYSYLTNQPILLLATGLISAFSHPLMQYFSIILFIFPRTSNRKEVGSFSAMRYFAYAVILTYFGFILYLFFRRPDLIDAHLWQHTDPVDRKFLFLSMFCTMAYLFIICRSFTDNKLLERAVANLRVNKILVAIGVVAVAYVSRMALAGPMPAFGFKDFRLNLTLQSISDPFEFLVSHLMFFGLAVFFIIAYFKKYQVEILRLGIGFTLFIYAIFVLGIGSETRQYIFALPFLVLPLTLIFQKYVKLKIWPFLVVSALLLSKVWFPLNQGQYDNEPLRFPDQYLFMNLGPWMISLTYLIQLGLLIVMAVVYFKFYHQRIMKGKQIG